MAQWTSLKLIEWTTEYFTDKEVPNPRLDAELLLASCLKCERIDLYTQHNKPLSPTELKQFRTVVARRAKREPLQYILGEVNFMGHRIQVNQDVLIPRPETEFVIEEAIKCIVDKNPNTILDIGTGSGCMAIALAARFKSAQITATDMSPAALKQARHNAAFNQVADRIEFIKTDLFPSESVKFDLIVSNPPYVSSRAYARLQTEVKEWEPKLALEAGKDGLDVYRCLQERLGDFLKSGAFFVGEIGSDQAMEIDQLFRDAPWCESVQIAQDLSGHPRVVMAQKRGH